MITTAPTWLALTLSLLGVGGARGRLLSVPGSAPTIQAAIDAAHDGDTVLVHAGVFRENIDFKGKAITVRSRTGAHATVIDGGFAGSVVTFASGEGALSVLEGFTITHGGPAGGRDGGVWCAGTSPSIVHNVIRDNSADLGGGGITSRDGAPLIRGNRIDGNCAFGAGGAIQCERSLAVLIANRIAGNCADLSGGGIFCTDSSVRLMGCELERNQAGASGGALAAEDSSLSIDGCSFRENTAAGDGGAVACLGGFLHVDDSSFAGNWVVFGAGGAISARGTQGGHVQGSHIESNRTANFEGAGIACDGAILELADDTIVRNSLGGVAVVHGGAVTLSRCQLEENSAITGGGLEIDGSSPHVAECVIRGNDAFESGGGVSVARGSPLIVNCIVADNEATTGDGGGIHALDATPVIVACTVTRNVLGSGGADQRGGGMAFVVTDGSRYGFGARVTNAIVWGNDAPSGIEIFSQLGSLRVTYSDVGGGWPGEGNIAMDPRLTPDTYHLTRQSPCVNAGDPDVPGAGDRDIDGDPRVIFGLPDLGADEWFESSPAWPRKQTFR